MQEPKGRKFYFVDEAGDDTIFNARGAVIVGGNGVSRTFMVGFAELPDPADAARQLDALRQSLLSDPYLKGIPSLDPSRGKTAAYFHAKDDCPEVRREVFRMLPKFNALVHVAFRRKADLITLARGLHAQGSSMSASNLYDDLVSRVFQSRLHLAEHNEICFARRGKSDRQDALLKALTRSRTRFETRWRVSVSSTISVRSSVPSSEPGLQVIDYYLWSLQRLIERGEDRFFASVADQFGLIIDEDDKRASGAGRYYSAKDPLTLKKIKPLES